MVSIFKVDPVWVMTTVTSPIGCSCIADSLRVRSIFQTPEKSGLTIFFVWAASSLGNCHHAKVAMAMQMKMGRMAASRTKRSEPLSISLSQMLRDWGRRRCGSLYSGLSAQLDTLSDLCHVYMTFGRGDATWLIPARAGGSI